MIPFKSIFSVTNIIVPYMIIKTYANASLNILGHSGCFCLSLPSNILMPDNTALCTARLYKIFLLYLITIVNLFHHLIMKFTKSLISFNSSSLISFLLLSSISIVSFVGKFLYFSTKVYTSSYNNFSILFVK